MILPFKSKSHLRCLNSSSFVFLPSIFKWVSTQPQFFHQSENPFLQLHSLFNTGSVQTNFIHEQVLLSALKSCSSRLAASQGQQIHCLVSTSGLKSNTFLRNSLINMYAKCGLLADAICLFDVCPKSDPVPYNIMIAANIKSGKLDDARKLFDIMPTKGCVSYTSMIRGYSQNNCWAEAIELFKQMRNVGVVPNEVTMATVISAFPHLSGIWDCRMLYGQVIKMMLVEFVLISTNVVRIYCVCSSLVEARALLDEISNKNIVSWNVMLNGYSKAGLLDLAKEVFDRIPNKDVVSWCIIVDGYVQVEKFSEALKMYRSMLSVGLPPNDFVNHA